MASEETEKKEKEKAFPDEGLSLVPTILMTIFWKILGIGIAFFLCHFVFPIERAMNKIDQLEDLGFLYLSIFVLTSLTSSFLLLAPQHYRSKIRFARPDMFLYKVVPDWRSPSSSSSPSSPSSPNSKSPSSSSSTTTTGYAILEREGTLGQFNRSSRAIYNYHETFPSLLAHSIITGYVFPVPVFVLAMIQMVGRIFYSVGYSHSFDSRVAGFVVALFSMIVLEGLTFWAGVWALDLAEKFEPLYY